MAEITAGIGNVAPNAGLIEMAMAYSRSRVLCAAARLGIADALGDSERSAEDLATTCSSTISADSVWLPAPQGCSRVCMVIDYLLGRPARRQLVAAHRMRADRPTRLTGARPEYPVALVSRT